MKTKKWHLSGREAASRHQQNPDRNGLTKPGSERIDETRIKLKTFVLIRMFSYMLGSIREEYRFCP
jgi:hypothetical protein